jgi:two-component system phosphate regulon sensor histidine kinase PhoR
MVKIGLRGKLFGVSIALVVLGVLAGGLYLSAEMRNTMEQRIGDELAREAAAARELVLSAPDERIETIDGVADRVGAAIDSRVTVIDPSGKVLGDSGLSIERVRQIESHANRPEFVEALKSGRGRAKRYSTTVATDMLYVAVTYQRGGHTGVVRVAKPLSEIDDAVGRLRVMLLIAGLIGLIVAAAMSALASHWMLRTLRALVVGAHEVATRETRARVDVRSTDELGGLAGSINQLAEELEHTVGDLAGARARFVAVVEGMADAVIGLDSDRTVTVVNSAALELLGLPEAPLGEPLIEKIRAPGLDEISRNMDEPAQTELELPGGRRVLVQLTPQSGGGCVLVLRDVSEIRRLETVRRDFVANVSHELRTPVSIVRANAETLLDGAAGDPEHGPKLIEAIHRNAERLSRILADLLDLSRLDAGAYKLEPRTVNVAEAAARAVSAVERRAADTNTSISLDLDEKLAVRADPEALDQILVNYLENAIKYTPDGGKAVIRARAMDDGVRIEVVDDGPGIAPHHRERLFERFYRVDPGRSRDMGGTGLGLAIVKHLAENMGGGVGVDAVTPHGSAFWCRLPEAASDSSEVA